MKLSGFIDKVTQSLQNYCLRNDSRNHLQRALVYILLLLYLSTDSVAAQTSISTSNLNSIVKLFIFVHDCFDEVQLPAFFAEICAYLVIRSDNT